MLRVGARVRALFAIRGLRGGGGLHRRSGDGNGTGAGRLVSRYSMPRWGMGDAARARVDASNIEDLCSQQYSIPRDLLLGAETNAV